MRAQCKAGRGTDMGGEFRCGMSLEAQWYKGAVLVIIIIRSSFTVEDGQRVSQSAQLRTAFRGTGKRETVRATGVVKLAVLRDCAWNRDWN